MKAFPTTRNNEQTGVWQTEDGMELRDYFAAKAMQGILNSVDSFYKNELDSFELTKQAYKFADAMMKAREL